MKKKIRLSKKYREDLLKKSNVVGVGLGYRQKGGRNTDNKAIVVLVSKKKSKEELSSEAMVPRSLGGQLVDVIEIGDIRLLEEEEESQSDELQVSGDNRLRRYRPAPGGVSIGHYRITAGTLGAVVKDKYGGRRLVLSNNHVLVDSTSGSDGSSAVGGAVLQPGAYDGGSISSDIIASLVRYVPLQRTYQRSQCSTAGIWENAVNRVISLFAPQYRVHLERANSRGNLVDAAVAAPQNDGDLADTILGLGPVNGSATVSVGQKICFSGRTSGVMWGKVIAEDVSLFITMGPGEQVYFTDQLITTAVSRSGDSGSLLMNEKNQAVGLLFAGSDSVSVCNRIENVCRLLEIDF